ncbi:hypothetical protein RFI_13973 [Reticulomyxa filosa]|uniref:Uncharacterized protein n=1 Tax=Reticulomyxa filosa TaxID=46433 RepID=X6ND03_RETFI|nr:hypothetical protein RFI_13973 [Reticulomyxa filosa]|eukprot:ETO23207.1 hypothetical protein RFI_13973 [Reticulomyxa filosa]
MGKKKKLIEKLSNYRASIAEAYLLDGLKEDTNGNETKGNKKKKKKANALKVPHDNDRDQNEPVEVETEAEDNVEVDGNGDADTKAIIEGLKEAIMDLQQQLANERRYNMRLDLAHQTSVRESKMLQQELNKRSTHQMSIDTGASSLAEHKPVSVDLDMEREIDEGIRDITIAKYVAIHNHNHGHDHNHHDPHGQGTLTHRNHSSHGNNHSSLFDHHTADHNRLNPNAVRPGAKRRNEVKCKDLLKKGRERRGREIFYAYIKEKTFKTCPYGEDEKKRGT